MDWYQRERPLRGFTHFVVFPVTPSRPCCAHTWQSKRPLSIQIVHSRICDNLLSGIFILFIVYLFNMWLIVGYFCHKIVINFHDDDDDDVMAENITCCVEGTPGCIAVWGGGSKLPERACRWRSAECHATFWFSEEFRARVVCRCHLLFYPCMGMNEKSKINLHLLLPRVVPICVSSMQT